MVPKLVPWYDVSSVPIVPYSLPGIYRVYLSTAIPVGVQKCLPLQCDETGVPAAHRPRACSRGAIRARWASMMARGVRSVIMVLLLCEGQAAVPMTWPGVESARIPRTESRLPSELGIGTASRPTARAISPRQCVKQLNAGFDHATHAQITVVERGKTGPGLLDEGICGQGKKLVHRCVHVLGSKGSGIEWLDTAESKQGQHHPPVAGKRATLLSSPPMAYSSRQETKPHQRLGNHPCSKTQDPT
jgi:hypothetical protein